MVDAWQRAVNFVLCGVYACMHVFMHMGMCLHICECGDQRVDAGCLFQSFSLQDLSLNPELTGVIGPAKATQAPRASCLPARCWDCSCALPAFYGAVALCPGMVSTGAPQPASCLSPAAFLGKWLLFPGQDRTILVSQPEWHLVNPILSLPGKSEHYPSAHNLFQIIKNDIPTPSIPVASTKFGLGVNERVLKRLITHP